jgi:hypothetical protein
MVNFFRHGRRTVKYVGHAEELGSEDAEETSCRHDNGLHPRRRVLHLRALLQVHVPSKSNPLVPVRRRLDAVELGVGAAAGHQIIMRADFGHAGAVHYDN